MSLINLPSSFEIEDLVRLSLKEDLGDGDITTDSILRENVSLRANAVAKQDLILCGGDLVKEVFRQMEPEVNINLLYNDGVAAITGKILFTLEGDASSILKGERTALNMLQYLSGIATFTQKFVEAAQPVKVLDTRKTHPGLRKFEKYAVARGGGWNHRFGLYDALLIKDNHIKAAGGIIEAIRRSRKTQSHNLFVEVETTSLQEVREAVTEKPDRILLDNMTTDEILQAVEIIGGMSEVEVSGSINLEKAKDLASTGIDYISVGSLTHSAPWADISLNFI